MVIICTPREAAEVAAIARRLGGYEEMLRLEQELRLVHQAGKEPTMVMDKNGKRHVVAKE